MDQLFYQPGDTMSRSLLNIMVGGFGRAGTQADPPQRAGTVRSVGVDDAAIQLAYAQNVIVVPGYGSRWHRHSTRCGNSETSSRTAA